MPKAEQELSARFGRPERLTDCLARGGICGEIFAKTLQWSVFSLGGIQPSRRVFFGKYLAWCDTNSLR